MKPATSFTLAPFDAATLWNSSTAGEGRAGVDHLDTAEFYGFGFADAVIREALHSANGVLVVARPGADPVGSPPLRPAQRPEQLRSLGIGRLSVINLRRHGFGPRLRPEGDRAVDLDDRLAARAGSARQD